MWKQRIAYKLFCMMQIGLKQFQRNTVLFPSQTSELVWDLQNLIRIINQEIKCKQAEEIPIYYFYDVIPKLNINLIVYNYMKKAQQSNNQYTLKTAQQQAFLQIFNLHATNGKITKQDLADIFYRIGFKVSQQHFSDICDKSFAGRSQISFEQFMETFKIKQSNFDLVDIKNAFRLIAGDSDELISVKNMQDLFVKNGIQEERVKQIIVVLSSYIDNNGMFNFKKFLSHLS